MNLQSGWTYSLVVVAVLVCANAGMVAAQDENPWLPILPEDLALTDNPAVPGSSAMILLKKETRDDARHTSETYYRIKIFTDSGRQYGDIEIPYIPKRAEVDSISARVVESDGSILNFRGAVYEKTLARRGGVRLMAKTFTLPEVRAGAIIEYRYSMKFKSALPESGPWVIQENLFIREAQLELRPMLQGWVHRIFSRSLSTGNDLVSDDKGISRVTLRNLPAFEEEPYMPPEATLKARYHIFYQRPWVGFQTDPRNEWQRYFNEYIGKDNALASATKELTSPNDTADAKVRKLYMAVQARIRNLSYEESYTKQERKRESIKERKSAQDVWRFSYGTAGEIAMLFAALCRGAGLTADIVGVVSRDSQFYDPAIQRIDQVDDWLVAVDLPTSSQLFDPGTRFAPFGWVAWQKQGVQGVRFGAQVPDVFVQLRKPEENTRRRQFDLTLQPDGSAQVRLVTTYSGEEAIDRRNDFFDLPREARELELRKELKESYPSSRIREISWNGMDDASDQATISYTFDLPSMAQVLETRLVVQPRLFDDVPTFPNWKRKHPVYLRRSGHTLQDVRIVLPPGYELEHVPAYRQHNFNLGNAAIGQYEAGTNKEGDAIVFHSRLTTEAISIEPWDYVPLKQFYDQVRTSNQTHLVLRKSSKE
ncbi:MAG TPA: DUF3857 domain-containing protein [Terriglobia bacterium]|nr:DUF3857 domain-containing protein [Terriglobia bacterium]